jgi:hypothetical protein
MYLDDDIQVPVKPVYAVGIDVGQARDYTALAILEKMPPNLTPLWGPGSEVAYACRHLERLPLQQGYPDQVRYLQRVITRLRAHLPRPYVYVGVDGTGIGRAIIDMLWSAGIGDYAITITGGSSVHYDMPYWNVPKRDLIGRLQVLLQQRALTFSEHMPYTRELIQELRDMRVKISGAGHDSYGAWREGSHDDLVLAVAIGVWVADRASTYVPEETP